MSLDIVSALSNNKSTALNRSRPQEDAKVNEESRTIEVNLTAFMTGDNKTFYVSLG